MPKQKRRPVYAMYAPEGTGTRGDDGLIPGARLWRFLSAPLRDQWITAGRTSDPIDAIRLAVNATGVKKEFPGIKDDPQEGQWFWHGQFGEFYADASEGFGDGQT